MAPNGAPPHRPPEWKCPHCDFDKNFGNRVTCYICDAPCSRKHKAKVEAFQAAKKKGPSGPINGRKPGVVVGTAPWAEKKAQSARIQQLEKQLRELKQAPPNKPAEGTLGQLLGDYKKQHPDAASVCDQVLAVVKPPQANKTIAQLTTEAMGNTDRAKVKAEKAAAHVERLQRALATAQTQLEEACKLQVQAEAEQAELLKKIAPATDNTAQPKAGKGAALDLEEFLMSEGDAGITFTTGDLFNKAAGDLSQEERDEYDKQVAKLNTEIKQHLNNVFKPFVDGIKKIVNQNEEIKQRVETHKRRRILPPEGGQGAAAPAATPGQHGTTAPAAGSGPADAGGGADTSPNPAESKPNEKDVKELHAKALEKAKQAASAAAAARSSSG